MDSKLISPKPDEQSVVGFSNVPCVVSEEMRVIMHNNSVALEEMMRSPRKILVNHPSNDLKV
jgi:hypothetical protein